MELKITTGSSIPKWVFYPETPKNDKNEVRSTQNRKQTVIVLCSVFRNLFQPEMLVLVFPADLISL